jgi:putative FmdB family regulatory protein
MTYEYICGACGHQWEAEQSIKDRPLEKCVSCGKSSAKRLVSGGTGFLLKGGGWYADLYASANAKPAASSEKSDKSEKADAKPAASESGSKESAPKDAKPAASSSGNSSGGASSSPTSS